MSDRAALAQSLMETAFRGPIGGSLTPRRVGAEVEFIPVEALTGRRCLLEGETSSAMLPFLRRFGGPLGWREGSTAKGTPCFTLPAGGSITFEPGGQLEYSSPPCHTATDLLGVLRSVVVPLRAAAKDEGIDLLAAGIDPLNSIEGAPLLLEVRRYQRMAEYFASRSPAGAVMMRQTASFQMSLDFDDEPWLRWRVLNAMAPYAGAIFANSPIYAGCPTGYQSTRSVVWRDVDPARTGIVCGEFDPIDVYLDFALSAPSILFPTLDGDYRPFADWLQVSEPTPEEWHDHLSTLFPEVRPRGHLELRSPDAVHPRWFAAPVALVTGILYEPGTLRAADDLLGVPDPTLIARAGTLGLRDEALAQTSADLFELALRGCRGLGPAYFHPDDLEQAIAFYDRYTRRGRAPADDVLEKAIAA